MSLGSRADIVPFTRFLEVRQRRQHIATATNTDLTPPPSDVRTSTESPTTTIDEERAATECPRNEQRRRSSQAVVGGSPPSWEADPSHQEETL
jgi:hypothetical protein